MENVYTNAPYTVSIVRDFESNGETMDIYAVVNTETNVREAEMRTYPGAVTAADHLAAEYSKLSDGEEEGVVIEFEPDLRTVN